MKVYIAGSITHNPNYKADFKRGEKLVRSIGHEPISPLTNAEMSYREYINNGLDTLGRCDGILLLQNWQQSKGACLEKHYAKTVGIKIFKERDLIFHEK